MQKCKILNHLQFNYNIGLQGLDMIDTYTNSIEWNKIKQRTKMIRREAWVWKEIQRARKESSPDGLLLPNQNTILINTIWYYFRRYGKSTMKFNYQKQNWLEQSKNETSSSLPWRRRQQTSEYGEEVNEAEEKRVNTVNK